MNCLNWQSLHTQHTYTTNLYNSQRISSRSLDTKMEHHKMIGTWAIMSCMWIYGCWSRHSPRLELICISVKVPQVSTSTLLRWWKETIVPSTWGSKLSISWPSMYRGKPTWGSWSQLWGCSMWMNALAVQVDDDFRPGGWQTGSLSPWGSLTDNIENIPSGLLQKFSCMFLI